MERADRLHSAGLSAAMSAVSNVFCYCPSNCNIDINKGFTTFRAINGGNKPKHGRRRTAWLALHLPTREGCWSMSTRLRGTCDSVLITFLEDSSLS